MGELSTQLRYFQNHEHRRRKRLCPSELSGVHIASAPNSAMSVFQNQRRATSRNAVLPMKSLKCHNWPVPRRCIHRKGVRAATQVNKVTVNSKLTVRVQFPPTKSSYAFPAFTWHAAHQFNGCGDGSHLRLSAPPALFDRAGKVVHRGFICRSQSDVYRDDNAFVPISQRRVYDLASRSEHFYPNRCAG